MLLFVGSYTAEMNGDGVGITTFARNGSQLRRIAETAAPAPSYLVADPARPLLFAANELTDGSVSSYRIGADGALQLLSTQPTGGVWPCHLALHDGHVILANYGSGTISVHPVSHDGWVGERTGLVQHTGQGARPDRQEGPHPHQVLVERDEVTIVDLGIDQLVHYRPVDGQLHRTGHTAVRAGSGPRHAVVHRSGRWFVAAELSSELLSLHRDSSTPAIDAPARGSLAATSVETGNQPSAIVMSRDQRHLYLANRGADTIARFRIDDDGVPSLVGEVSCGGDWPRDICLVENLLFVANERSHTVVAFRLDADSGVPEPTGDVVEVGSPTCVLPW